MGQKVNPIGLRLKINRMWDSHWFAGRNYAETLAEDLELRRFFAKRLAGVSLARVLIERTAKKPRITLFSARPGLIIGKKGADIEKLRAELSAMISGEVTINIVEVRKPETNAVLVAENIAQQLERRMAFRRTMKRAIQNAMRFGALGIRINVAGRLNDADIARMAWYRDGQVPLHTLRANIEYGFRKAQTSYGVLGVKVWIYHGQVMRGQTETGSDGKEAVKSKSPRPVRERANG